MHVLVKIAVLVLLAFMLGHMSNLVLSMFAVTLFVLGFLVDKQHLKTTIKRIRWLLLVMLCVYVFGTPGQYIDLPIKVIRPTYEGVTLGLQQVFRMITMLAGLSLLLSTTSRTQLVSGLYQLMSQFSWAGVDAERFTSRLWLTLEYVDQQDKTPLSVKAFQDVFGQLENEADNQNNQQEHIELTLQRLSTLDRLLLTMMLLFTLWLGLS